jgi:hypothetical protein
MTTVPEFTFPDDPDASTSGGGKPALAPGELIVELGDQQITARLRPRPTTGAVRPRPGQAISKSLDEATAGVTFTAPDNAGRVIARTADDPQTARSQISGAFRVATPEGDLLAAHYEASTPMLLPGPQPRGMSGTRVSDPVWPAPTIRDGIPCYRFASLEHYRSTTAGDITRTVRDLRARNRSAEILATGVRQELATHLAYIVFDDGTPDQLVVLIRDGITRWTGCLMIALGIADNDRLTPQQVSEQIVDRLLPLVRLKGTTRTDAFHVAQHAARATWLREFTQDQQAARGDRPASLGQRAIHLNQALVAPIRLYLPTEADGQMIGAIDRMVADVHTGQQRWEEEDQSFRRALDILHAMHRQGVLTDDDLSLILDVDPDQHPLDRAAHICKVLLHDEYHAFKAEMRRQGEYGAVHLHHAVDLVATVLSRPWAGYKPMGSAWGYKGVLDVAFPDSARVALRSPDAYLDLVPLALDGDVDAVRELRLVGAIALVANGRVTTSLLGGSGGAKKQVRRITFSELFKGLVATEDGLTQLALAADWFHADDDPANDLLPAVDLDAEGSAAVDANNHVRNAAKGGVQSEQLADLAREGLESLGQADDADTEPDVDPKLRARHEMELAIDELEASAAAQAILTTTIATKRAEADMAGHDVVGRATWDTILKDLLATQTGLLAFRPTGPAA